MTTVRLGDVLKGLAVPIQKTQQPPSAKIQPFHRGQFFCESKILTNYIDKLGCTAVALRILLSAKASNKKGKRTTKMTYIAMSKGLGCSERTAYRACESLLKHGFLKKLGQGRWELIEPSGKASAVLAHTAEKSHPRQLNIFQDIPNFNGGGGNRTRVPM